MAELTDKQRAFVQEYLVDLNATQAAIRAGYSEKTAQQIGAENLSKPVIAEAIAAAQKERAERTQITADRVLTELGKIGFANMEDYIQTTFEGDAYVDLSQMTRDQAAAVSEITVEDYKDGRGEDARDVRKVRLKLSDKRAALVDIGKHLGMFVERKQLSGPNGGPIPIEETPASARLNAIMDRIAPAKVSEASE